MSYHKPAYFENDGLDEYRAKIADQYSQSLARECGFRNCEGADYLDWEMKDIISGINRDTPEQRAAKQRFVDSLPPVKSRMFTSGGIWDADHECCPLPYRGINNHCSPGMASKTNEELEVYLAQERL